jgi:hypothetical protein
MRSDDHPREGVIVIVDVPAWVVMGLTMGGSSRIEYRLGDPYA